MKQIHVTEEKRVKTRATKLRLVGQAKPGFLKPIRASKTVYFGYQLKTPP